MKYIIIQVSEFIDTFGVEADSEEEALRICHESDPHDPRWSFEFSPNMVRETIEPANDTAISH